MKKKILLILIMTIAVLATLCVASTFLLGYCPVIGRMIANAKLSEQSGEKTLSYEKLSKHIVQFDEDDLPMDYIEWRKTGELPQYN